MRRSSVFLLFLTLLLLNAGCQPRLIDAQIPLPLTGAAESRLGAAALTIQEQPGENAFAIVPVSTQTGQPLDGASPLALGGAIAYGFSKDRTQMAFLSNRTEGCLTYCLRIMNLVNWQEMVTPIPVEKRMSAWFIVPEFDQTSDRIPLILNLQTDTSGELLLVDRVQRSVTARVSLPASVYQAVITPEGNLAVHGLTSGKSGTEPLLYLALFDGTDLHLLWEKTLPEVPIFVDGGGNHSDPLKGKYYEPAAVFTGDGSRLYIAAADQPLLLTVDFPAGVVRSTKIEAPMSWWERLLAHSASTVQAKAMNGTSKVGVLSPDGRYLYVVGQEMVTVQNTQGGFETTVVPLGLQVIDTRDGTLLQQIETKASRVTLAMDGKTLLLHGWDDHPWTDVLDTTSWQVRQRIAGFTAPSRLLDGSFAWLVSQERGGQISSLEVFLPGEPEARSQITASGYLDWIVIP